jgi:hypothetical protein
VKLPNNLATLNAKTATPELLRTLASETDRIITSGTASFNRYGLLYDTRYAIWPGQNEEGTKETEDAFPWFGASDTRVRLADTIIRERLNLRKAGLWGKRLQARPFRGANTGASTLVNTLIKWMLYTQALPMLTRETQLAWSYLDTYGAAVMGCFWKRRTRLESHTIDLQELAALAQAQQSQEMVQLIVMIANPLMDPQTVAGFQKLWPDNSEAQLAGVVKRLRTTGTAEVRSAYICTNDLDWLALRPGIDVFFDASLHDLQDAPLITVRELLTEADVREREASEGWDPEFIELAVKQKGKTTLDYTLDPLRMAPRGGLGGLSSRGVMAEDLDQRIEILRSFYYVHERGTSALYQTIYHRSVPEVAAFHELHSYDHGEMPFFAWRAETIARPILESRGVPEICLTWQIERKVERDFLTDRMSLEILPTLQVPRGRAGDVLLGPGAQIERKRQGDYEFLAIPQPTSLVGASGKQLEREICEYFHRAHPELDPIMTQLGRQALVTDALNDIIPLTSQSWKLMQQYCTDEEIQAVAGPQASGLRIDKRAIQGSYLFEFTYDVRVMEPEFLTTIITAIKEILPMDRMGVIDVSGLVEFLLHSIAPDLAERFVRPAQAAQMADVKDELAQAGLMALGIEPPMVAVTNPEMRMQALQQVLQSPRYLQIVQGDQTGTVKKLIENQLEKYQFQIQQQVNAQTGRMGVKPVLGSPDGLPQPGGGGTGMEAFAGQGGAR